ncbi:acyltransferase [Thermocoleostomius sinensis]|jgi:acetyltransferase-like isoleucine patch superfamily enzyme|uniref:acyltransferase n=1 Tax=Thermocoleostomius sinensis TaxID=3065396 RepID=UPI0028F43CD2|nr:acyltransferase [Thermocoleostomius sinensis]
MSLIESDDLREKFSKYRKDFLTLNLPAIENHIIRRTKFRIHYEPSSILSYFIESTVLRSVGWVPGLFGALLRNLIYQPLFAKMELLAFIEAGVEIKSAGSIELEKQALIHRGVYLNGWHKNSRICLKERAYLDRNVTITVHENGYIEIGKLTYIGPSTCIAGPGPVRIGSYCLISSGCGIYGNNHVFDDPTILIREQGFTNKGITIEDDCWLGTGVKVLDGVTIGKGSVIGAGAVVTKDIPAYSVAVGVPARVISKRGVKGSSLEK